MLPAGWTVVSTPEEAGQPPASPPMAVPQPGPAKPVGAPTEVAPTEQPDTQGLPAGWTVQSVGTQEQPRQSTGLPPGWTEVTTTEVADVTPDVAQPVDVATTDMQDAGVEGPTYDSLKSNDAFQQHLKNIRSHGWGQDPDAYTPDENVRDFANYMRNVFSNEVSGIKFLRRLQNAPPEEVRDWSEAYQTFDSVPGFLSAGGAPVGEALLDYAEGILTSPSTAAGVFTGGVAKGAGIGALTATQALIRGALVGGGLDAAVAAGHDRVLQSAEKEMDLRDETDWGRVAITGAVGGLPGGAVGAVRRFQANEATKVIRDELAAGQKVAIERKAAVRKATIEQRYTPDMEGLAKQVDGDLEAFFRSEAQKGRDLLEGVSPSTDLIEPALREDMVKAITVAAKDLADKGDFQINLGGDHRVGWQIYQAIDEGKIDIDQYRNAMADAGLDLDDFKTLFWSEESRAGRILNFASQVARKNKQFGGSEKSAMDFYFGPDAEKILARLNDEAVDLSMWSKAWHKLDATRIGMMVTQPATAMRNVAGAVGHVAMDVGVRGLDNTIAMMTGTRPVKWGDTFEIFNRMASNAETREIAYAITNIKANKKEYNQLFRSYNEVNRELGKSTGVWGVVDNVVDTLNIFNKAQDHLFRQTTFVASVQRQLNQSGSPSLQKIIADGNIDKIDKEIIERAMHDAHRITFTDEPTNETAQRILEGFRKAPPFLASTFVPFPRFMLSAMKFQYEFSPLGLTSVQAWRNAKAGNYTDLSKTIIGTATFGAALAVRNSESAGDKWYEIVGEDGTIHDVRPYFPFAPYLFAADWYKRWRDGSVADTEGFTKEFIEAFGGVTFRGGSSSYASADKMFMDLFGIGDDGGQSFAQVAGDFFANITSSYSTPLTVVRDVQAQFDPDMQYMRDSRGEKTGDFWGTIRSTVGNKFHERLPDVTVLGREFGRQTLPDRRSPLRTDTRQYVDPLLKQFTGVSSYSYKNPVEQEFDRLNIKPNTVFTSSGDPSRDRMELYYFADQYEREANRLIHTGEYKNSSPALKAFQLRKLASQNWEHLGGRSIRSWAKYLADLNDPRAALRLAYNSIPAYERRVHEYEIPDENERYRALFGVSPDMEEVAIEYWYLHKNRKYVDPDKVDQQLRDLGLSR